MCGASMEACPRLDMEPPIKPAGDDIDAWSAYVEEYIEKLIAYYESRDPSRDAAALTLVSGARGSYRMMLKVVGTQGVVADLDGGLFAVRHGYAEGLTPQEVMVNCIGTREGMARSVGQYLAIPRELAADEDTGHGVLARAMRARNPGVVFARAAAAGSIDPLDRPRWRLFVGLPPR